MLGDLRTIMAPVIVPTGRLTSSGESTVTVLLPPFWLIRAAVAAVWLYEGLWCKLLGGEPHQVQVVEAVPYFGPRIGGLFLKALGTVETGLAVWALSAAAPIPCAVAQTLLLVTLNANGLLWARHIIHDPGGMVVKNFAFLVLAWVSASLPGWT
jgi:DoxX-like protein